MLRTQQHPGQVHVEVRLPAVQREVEEGRRLCDAGVVHHDVAALPSRVDVRESGCHGLGVADIEQHGIGTMSDALQGLGLGAGLGLVDIADQDVMACAG